jgi:uncharacterized protein with HEPN domain
MTTHAIRIWERRHGAVTPQRTGKNRRLYSDADIERLRLLKAITGAGHSIAQIAELAQEELRSLAAATQARAGEDGSQSQGPAAARIFRCDPSRDESRASRAWRLYLQDMEQSAERVLEYRGQRSRAEVEADRLTYDAMLRNLELIGEAARNLPEHVRALVADIPWNGFVSLRETLAHEYFSVDADAVWDAIDREVPLLLEAVRRLDKGSASSDAIRGQTSAS